MAVTYPLAASAFWEQFRFAGRPEFKPLFRERQSEDGGGNTLTAFLGSPKWTAEVALEGGRHNANMTQEVDLHQLRMRAGTFLAYDIRRPYPASDAGGVFLDNGSLLNVGDVAASGNTATGAYTVEGVSVGLTTALTVAGDAGTYFDAAGAMQTASANVLRVDYGPFANYIRNFKATGAVAGTPGTLPTYWGSTIVPSGISRQIVGSGVQDGINYVDFRFFGIAGSTNVIYIAPDSVAASVGQTWCISMWLALTVNSGIAPTGRFYLNAYNSVSAFVDGSPANSIALSSTLSRFSHSRTLAGAATASLVTQVGFTVTNGQVVDFTVRVGVPLLNLGSTALTYPRSPLGVLAEPSFTNLLRRSEEFDDSYWTKTRSSISPNADIAPDGATTADKLVDTADNGTHVVSMSTISNVAGQALTASVFVKSAGRTRGSLRIQGSAGQCIANFDLTAKTAAAVNSGSGVTSAATITELGNGWFLASVTGIATASDTNGSLFLYTANAAGNISYVGDGTSGFMVWGAQLTQTASPRSYVKTTSTSVARAADALTLKGKGTNDWTVTFDNDATQAFNDDEGDFTPTASGLTRPHIKKWTATRDTQPSASVVQIKSKGSNNRSFALKGLPPFFTVTKGDKISVLYSTTKYFLCEAMETVVADYLGETAEFEISPYMPPGIAVNDAVTLKKPCGKFKLVADSYRAASGRGNISDGVGFSMLSVP